MQLIITEAEAKFRQDPELRAEFSKLRRSGFFGLIEDVLKAGHPMRQRPPSQSDSDKITLLGRVYGYQEVLDIFERLERDLPLPPKPMQSTFGVNDAGEPENQEQE